MRSKALLLGSFIALLAVPAMAQGNNAINLVGTVDKVDASSITVKMEESTETVKIAPNVLYLQNKPAKLSDIKANDFVAWLPRLFGPDQKHVHAFFLSQLLAKGDEVLDAPLLMRLNRAEGNGDPGGIRTRQGPARRDRRNRRDADQQS